MDAKEAIEELERTIYNDYVTSNAAIYAAIEALEKQIPKKAKSHDNNFYYECPVCHCKCATALS